MIGKRDFEESYQINTAELEIDLFFGRSNLKNKSTEIRQHHHTRDFWFCSECEDRFSTVENKLSPIIEKIRNNKFSLQKISFGNVLFLNGVDQIDFDTFIYSLIYRISLRWRLEFSSVLSPEEEEYLRKLLNILLDKKENDYTLRKKIPFLVIMPEEYDLKKNGIYTEQCTDYNLYFFAEFIVLYLKNGDYYDYAGSDQYELNSFIHYKELLNINNQQPIIGLMTSSQWKEILKKHNNRIATLFFENNIQMLKNTLSLSEESIKNILSQKLYSKLNKGIRPFDAIKQSTNEILNEYQIK